MQAGTRICPKCERELPEETGFCPFDGTPLLLSKTPTAAELEASLARRFRIIRRLGAGGMGVVFLAEQLTIGRPIALKVLLRKFLDEPEFLLRFHNEAASTGRIHHPNVVTIYEYGQSDDGSPYIAMEYLEGETLRELLKSHGAMPLPAVIDIARQVARGLHAAHKLGIIHRDLKPDNIFVTLDDEGERLVKVVDFGIAKLREAATHTTSGIVMGTPPYMSFEQASGMRSDQLDPRSDVYSLGIVTYEMISGRLPFHADTPLGYLNKHLLEEPPSLRSIRPDLRVPRSVEMVVKKALTKNRDERYATALEFAGELRDAVLGERTLPSTRVPRPRLTVSSDEQFAIKPAEGGAAGTAVETPPSPPKVKKEAPSRPLSTPEEAPARRAESRPPPAPPLQPTRAPSSRRKTVILGILFLGTMGVLLWQNWSSVRQLAIPEAVTPTSPKREPVLPPSGMSQIPGGAFLMGRNEAEDPEETPAHSVTVPPFFLGTTPVSSLQYAEFLRAKTYPAPSHWTSAGLPSGQGEWPATNVSWQEARAYCEWKGMRLPTEAEWEFAARGTDGRLYPWGNEFAARLTNSAESKLAHPEPVGLRAAAASPFGVLDMSGNVWQWCEDDYKPYPGHQSGFPIPEGAKVIRGGSFKSDQQHVTTTTRNFELATDRSPRIGFRCAKTR
jgi:serine/threonine protein kinase